MQRRNQILRIPLPIRPGFVRFGCLHPAAGEQIFGFGRQISDHTVGKACAHAIGHVAVANDAGGYQDRRLWVARRRALQLLTKRLAHTPVADLIQPIHQQQDLSFRQSIEDHSRHHLRLLRLKLRLVQMHVQHLFERAA